MEKLLKITFLFFMFCYGCFGCIPSEREALLEFKNKLKDPSNRLRSWDNNTGDGDCCQWYGVICSNSSSHVLELHLETLSEDEYYVERYYRYHSYYYYYNNNSAFGGEISSCLLNLKHLRYLDLSHNDFDGIPIPKFLGSLRSLRYLNLSGSNFGGIIPRELGNLSNLIYLNLKFDHSLSIDSLDWVSGLSLLEFLDLSSIDLSQFESVNWLEVINKLPSLVELHLSHCQIVHIPPLVNLNFSSLSVLDLSIPKWIFSLRNLISLNLGGNHLGGSIPSELQNVSSTIKELDLSANGFNSSIPNWLYDFSHLESLNLGFNSLSGRISSAIQNMTSLTNLDLSGNVGFEGGIPKSLKNLCTLKSISFSGTKLGQEMNEILNILSSGCSSNLLESLDLSSCELSGKLTNQLGNFKNLVDLRLSHNLISGPIPMALGELKSLRFLFLDHNKLGGTVPAALGGLAKLEQIDISNNLLEGVVSEMHFANLTNLRWFDGSMNPLIRLRVSSDWIPPFLQLQVLKLCGWDIGDQFPISWFHTLKYVEVLDLSNSRISSTIPNWFWNSSFQLTNLNLSHNQFRGFISDINLTRIQFIDLSSNLFQGSLPRISRDTRFLDFSNNSFSGSISHFICHQIHEVKHMHVLDLGDNLLTGEIPDCWSDSWFDLNYLRLSNNNFSGNIPKSIGNLTVLYFLHL